MEVSHVAAAGRRTATPAVRILVRAGIYEQRENLKYIQVQMGHSSITVTLDVYGHLLRSTNQAPAEKPDALILGNG